MKRQPHVWAGSTTLLLAMSLFLFGCPKRPEVAETTPKAIGPQGVIAMPAPPLPSPPPPVGAPPPTVSAPEETEPEQPAEVLPEAEEVEIAEAEATEEVESRPFERAEALPESDTAATRPSETDAESEMEPGMQIKETEVGAQAEAPIEEAEVSPSPVAPRGEADEASPTAGAPGDVEVAPELPAQIIEEAEIVLPAPVEPSAPQPEEPTPGVGPGADVSVAGAEVTTPLPAESAASPAPVSPPSAPAPEAAAVAQVPELTLKDIFFDFDQSAIREDSNKTLAENILWLRNNPTAKVVIEGHCDERGSSEYNLALGERRAKVTRDFLVAGGIDPDRISTISYGKERPFVLGHDEAAWRWNRRAHFVVSPR
jgi:peptidoglycan-associated lipoprotein